MRHVSTFAAMAAFASLLSMTGTTPASAHASLEAGQATASSMYKAVMRIPHGCQGKPTIAVSIDLPDGVIAAKPMPKPGWKLETLWGAYDRAYDYYGTPKTEGVRRIVWSGGNLPDDFYDEFVFRARLDGSLAGTTVSFPVMQDCPGGAQVAWTQIPAAGRDAHSLEHPAPMLTVVAASSSEHGHGSAHQSSGHAPIAIEGPFARASAGPARNGAAYLTVRNMGGEADRLVGARAAVAARAELHTHLHENGIMKMRPVEAIEVPANGAASLQPGGDHVMLIGLTAPLKEGDTFPLTLVFEKAGEVEVEVAVGAVGAMTPGGGHGSDSHGGSHDTKPHGGHGTHKRN